MSWCDVEIEVTESALNDDPARTADHLRELAGLGVGISVDDFGMGQAALARLRHLPVSSLKVDRLFLTDVAAHPEQADITRAMIRLAHALQLRVVAEGVETDSELDFVRENGCAEGQGYLFARPVEVDELRGSVGRFLH